MAGPEKLFFWAGLEIKRGLHALLSTCTVALLYAEDRRTIVQSLCRSVVESGYFKLAWAGFPDSTGKMRISSAAGPAMAYLNGITICRDQAKLSGQSPAIACMKTNLSIINNDFSINASLTSWKERANVHGLRSSAAFPLHEKDNH